MSSNAEVEAALAAFNRVRAEVGGIKTDEQQRYAMNEALDAADRVRRSNEIGWMGDIGGNPYGPFDR